MALLAALGRRALRREPLARAAEGAGVAARLLEARAGACQPSTASQRDALDAQAAGFATAGCARLAASGAAAARGPREEPAVAWHPGLAARWQRGFAAAAAAAAGPGPSSTPGPQVGTVYIVSSANNTICTLADGEGRVVGWCSAGSLGFKHSRKSSTYAAQATGERIAATSLQKGFVHVRLVLKGLGYGKQSAARALLKAGVRVTEIHEQTAVPYNGCRAPKRRRG